MNLLRSFGSLRTRISNQDLAAWAFTAWVAWFTLRGHLPYIEQPYQQNSDEGYLLAVGMRMLKGHMLPFVDGVAHTGPLFLYSGALIVALEPFSWLPIRIVAAATFALMPVLLFLVGRAAGRPLAGAIAGFSIPLCTLLRWASIDGIAYNAETPVILCVLGALYSLLRGIAETSRAPSQAWCAAAGVFTAGIALSKQVGALQAAIVGTGFLVALLVREDFAAKQRWSLFAYFSTGALAPVLAIFGWLAAHGALKDAFYYIVTYNTDIYMFHLREVEIPKLWRSWLEAMTLEVMLLLGGVTWGLAQAVIAQSRSSSWRETGRAALFPLIITALAVTGLVGARASQRDFPHYYLLAVPWFGMLLGMMVEESLAMARERWLAFATRVVLLLPIWYAAELVWETRPEILGMWSEQNHFFIPLKAHEPPHMCTIIDAHSAPDDKLFVWGFRPELYVSCKRWPASRFVFTTFVSGYVPWNMVTSTDEENRLAVPGARALLLAELEATKPPVIIDAPISMAGRSMTAYPETGEYLNTHYRRLSRERDGDVWLREVH